MKKQLVYSAIPWLLTLISVLSVPPAHSQDLFSQLDEVKKDVSDLRAEV